MIALVYLIWSLFFKSKIITRFWPCHQSQWLLFPIWQCYLWYHLNDGISLPNTDHYFSSHRQLVRLIIQRRSLSVPSLLNTCDSFSSLHHCSSLLHVSPVSIPETTLSVLPLSGGMSHLPGTPHIPALSLIIFIQPPTTSMLTCCW